MSFKIKVLNEEGYIVTEVTGFIDGRAYYEYSKESFRTGIKSNIFRFLFDVRKAVHQESIFYRLPAGKEIEKIGLKKDFKVAYVSEYGENIIHYLETCLRNTGYDIRAFLDKYIAVKWLKE